MHYGHFYALGQTLAVGERIKFTEDAGCGRFILSEDGTEITMRINIGGHFFITSAWSASGEGALTPELSVNGTKIPYMTYILGRGQSSHISAMTGSIILHLDHGDNISVINRGPEADLVVPPNNTPEGSVSNAAATLTILRVASDRV